jgi:HK97 family phage major capsid protein
MSKKVFVNGKWITVEDKHVKADDDKETEEEETTTEETAEEAEETEEEETTEEVSDDEQKSIDASANKIAKSILKGMGNQVDNDAVSKLNSKVDKLLSNHGQDDKLTKILSGKDAIADVDELTKEEKIVAFWHGLVTGNDAVVKALSEGTNADGGFLFPNEFLNELVEELPNINVMRNHVRIIPMKRNVMNVTNLISGPEVTWTAENVAKSTTTARFSQLTLTAFKVASILYSSDELIEDSDIFDVVQLIIRLFAEAIAEEEERTIWVGDGSTQPQGIDTAGTIATVASVGQDFDDLVRLHYALPRKYRNGASFFMNDTTAQNIRLLKDSNNNYIWQAEVASGNKVDTEGRILGKPVVVSDWVPDNSIFFGDMKKCYFFGDRKSMAVKISQDTTQAFTQDMTAIRVVARVGGIVAQPLACRELTGF